MSRWATSHPLFGNTLRDVLEATTLPDDPQSARDTFKELAWDVYVYVRRKLERIPASTCSEKLHWSLTALRALRRPNICGLHDACGRWAPLKAKLAALGPSNALAEVLNKVISSLFIGVIDADIIALEVQQQQLAEDIAEVHTEHLRREGVRLRARRERWQRTRRRIVLASVRDDDDGRSA